MEKMGRLGIEEIMGEVLLEDSVGSDRGRVARLRRSEEV